MGGGVKIDGGREGGAGVEVAVVDKECGAGSFTVVSGGGAWPGVGSIVIGGTVGKLFTIASLVMRSRP